MNLHNALKELLGLTPHLELVDFFHFFGANLNLFDAKLLRIPDLEYVQLVPQRINLQHNLGFSFANDYVSLKPLLALFLVENVYVIQLNLFQSLLEVLLLLADVHVRSLQVDINDRAINFNIAKSLLFTQFDLGLDLVPDGVLQAQGVFILIK